jgi:O-antigen/teichoic acid export membrane protein
VRPAGPRTPRLSGFAIILIATAIAGVASYAVTILIPNQIGLAEYTIFAVFWSSIYLVVGGLGGIQQEVTRATLPAAPDVTHHASRARRFGIIAGALAFVSVVGTAPFWVGAVFPREGWSLVWPLAVGAASYVMVAVLAGSLYGVVAWIPLALMIAVDALLRLVALSVTLVFTHDIVALAWAVALPFPITLIVLWPFIRLSIVGRSQLDVGYRSLTWNVARTVVAATATAVMVSGFPLLLGLTSHSEPPAILGMFIVTITLTRAPLIVVALSLQSYLVVHFRDNAGTFWRYFRRLLGAVVVGGVALAVAGWLFGPAVYHFLFPNKLQPDAPFFAILVGSSALVAALCVTAPAVLARSKHLVYSAGWVAAAVATIVALLLPLDFASRTIAALVVGPSVGLIVHGAYLVSAGLREGRRNLP